MTLAHAILGMAVSAVVAGVLMVIYYNKYSALAEQVEQFAAKQAGSVSKVAGQVESNLKAPGK